jgi:uncharacterized damage-inducible protein DinB
MKNQTQLLLDLWEEARTRFSNQLSDIQPDDLCKKLSPSVNSLGFLIRHIADVELLFAKNVFGNHEITVSAKTLIAKKDTGEWTNKDELITYSSQAYAILKNTILNQNENGWSDEIETKEFGKKAKMEALGRIISHTAYHAGQIGIIKKYGS